MEKAINNLEVQFLRTKVGDRYVMEALKEKDWKIGGESSGHIMCLDKTTTGDGIIAGLQVLACMVKQEKSLNELVEDIQLLPQTLINIKTDHAESLAKNSKVKGLVNNLSEKLQGEGRVLLRPSGTEPVLRVMVEGPNSQEVESPAQQLSEEILSLDNVS